MSVKFFFNSISKKTAVLIFLASSLFTLLITGVQLYYEYESEKNKIINAIGYVEKTQSEHIANLLWRYDQTQLEIVARGLMSLKAIKKINIYVDEQNTPIIVKGLVSDDNELERWHKKFSLQSQDKLVSVGSLEIFYDFQEAKERVYYVFWSALFFQFIRSIVIGFFIYFLIDWSIIRRLSSLEKYLGAYRKDAEKTEDYKSPVFIEADELNRVAEVINNLLAEIQEAKNKIQDELTQKKSAQERLFQLSLQMGTLQANSGVFHDLNNLLMITLSQNKRLQNNQFSTPADLEKAFGVQAKSLKMMADIIKTHQEASKKANVPTECSILEVVQETLALEESQLQKSNVTVENQVNPNTKFHFSKSLIILVLINLIKNSREAMNLAGTENKIIKISNSENENYWILEVADNGPGVAPAFRDKLFEHGETTKVDGHGFGVSHCKKALQIQGGDLIYKDSAGTTGATFCIVYPKFHKI